MRPLAVLILVLGAVAALVFAFASFADDGREAGSAVTEDLVVRPAEEPVRPQGELDMPVDPAAPLPAARERREERQAIAAAPEEGTDRGAHTGYIFGTVVGPEGAPVPQAKLSLLRRPGGPSSLADAIQLVQEKDPPRPLRQTTTDAQGRFRFDGLAPAPDWSIVVNHERFARVEAGPIDVPEDGGVEERIQLSWGQGFHGLVVDAATGQPIEGASLRLDNPLAAFLPSTRDAPGRLETRTDEEGRYAFHNVDGGQKTLTLTAEGYATEVYTNFDMQADLPADDEPVVYRRNRLKQQAQMREQAAAEPREPLRYDFELETGGQIAGRVLLPDRSGLEGVEVEALNLAGPVGSRGTAVTTSGGEFLIEGLGDGYYTVHTEVPGYESTPVQRVEVGRSDVEIVLAEQGSVSGRVVDAQTGKPVQDFTVRIRTLHPQSVTWGAMVARRAFRGREDGGFSLGGLPEGEYVAEAFSRGYASSFSEPFQVTQGVQSGNVVVRLTQGGRLEGQVVDSYTGDPIAGAKVETKDNNYVDAELFVMLNSLSKTATTESTQTTDADGRFEVELMTPADYQVRVSKSGYTTLVLNDVKVADGLTTDLGPLRLLKGATITGTVRGPDGEPIAGANVLLNPTSTDQWNSFQGRTDANGRYKIQNAKAGSYQLSASRPAGPGANPFAPIVDMRHSQIDVTLEDGSSYEFDLELGPRVQ